MVWTLLEKGAQEGTRDRDDDDESDDDSDDEIGSSARHSAGRNEVEGADTVRGRDRSSSVSRSTRGTAEEVVGIRVSAINNEGGSEAGNGSSASAYATASNEINERAVKVITRVHAKLCGRDFGSAIPVEEQVQCLIAQATSHENISQGFLRGWRPLW
jgi:hypothetical protein